MKTASNSRPALQSRLQFLSASVAVLIAGAFLAPAANAGLIVDEHLASTTQILSSSNAALGATLAGVNLYFTNSIAPGSSVNGIFFDNIDMGTPPVGTVSLTANQPGVTLAISLPGTRDNSQRTLGPAITGPDAAVANTLLTDISYLGASYNTPDSFLFSGLGANQHVYVQTLGGGVWDGKLQVVANSSTIGTWTSSDTGPAIYGFDTNTDSSGNLQLDYSIASGTFSGLAGIIITEVVPEPGTALFGMACVSVAALRRRRSV